MTSDKTAELPYTQYTRGFAETAILGSFTVTAFQFHGRGTKEWHNEKGTRIQDCT